MIGSGFTYPSVAQDCSRNKPLASTASTLQCYAMLMREALITNPSEELDHFLERLVEHVGRPLRPCLQTQAASRQHWMSNVQMAGNECRLLATFTVFCRHICLLAWASRLKLAAQGTLEKSAGKAKRHCISKRHSAAEKPHGKIILKSGRLASETKSKISTPGTCQHLVCTYTKQHKYGNLTKNHRGSLSGLLT